MPNLFWARLHAPYSHGVVVRCLRHADFVTWEVILVMVPFSLQQARHESVVTPGNLGRHKKALDSSTLRTCKKYYESMTLKIVPVISIISCWHMGLCFAGRNQPNPILTCSWILREGWKSIWNKQHPNLEQACLVHLIQFFLRLSSSSFLPPRVHVMWAQSCLSLHVYNLNKPWPTELPFHVANSLESLFLM